VDLVADIQPAEHFRRFADFLEDQSDGALGWIPVGDGQGNTFAFIVDPQDDELAGLTALGDVVGLNLEQLRLGS